MLSRSTTLPVLASAFAVALFAVAPPPAHAGLGVGPSAPIDPTRIRAVLDQTGVVSAVNGAGVTLFVWTDGRSGNADIFGARVDADGNLLDPDGLEIASGDRAQGEPAVAWSGSSWLVAWSEEMTPGNFDVLATRVTSAGAVLDVPVIGVATNSSSESHPALAWDGARHLAVWELDQSSTVAVTRIAGTTIESNGTVNGPGAVISLSTSDTEPVLATAGATALLAFSSQRDGNGNVYAVRLTGASSGTLLTRLDALDVNLTAGDPAKQGPAAVASAAGGGWLVAWEDGRNQPTSGSDIFGTRVSAAGAVLDAGGIEIADETGEDVAVAVRHSGSDWLVTWSQIGSGQFLRHVANNGNPAPARLTVSSASGLAGDGTIGGPAATPLLAWSEPGPGSGQDVVARFHNPGGGDPFGPIFPLSSQTPDQTQPALAFSGSTWLIAWVDDRFGPTQGQIRVGFTDSAAFEPPVPATIQFAAPRPGLDQATPTAVYDGANFNLFWSEERGGFRRIVGARFTVGGTFIDSFTVSSGTWNETDPSAAYNRDSDRVVIAWSDNRAGTSERDIWGREWRNGTALDVEFAMLADPGVREELPKLATGAFSTMFMAFQRSSEPGASAIYGVFLFPPLAGDLFFDFPLREETGRRFEAPNIGFNGQDWLIAFHEVVENDGPDLHIPAVRLYSGAFGIREFADLGPGSYVPALPAVAGAGYNFMAAWGSLQGGVQDLYVRSVNPARTSDDIPFAATSGPAEEGGPAVASGRDDRAGFAYLKPQRDAEWNGLRLFGGEAQDTLAGKVVINEFLANPPSDAKEFVEFFNKSGRTFNLNGWRLEINDDDGEVVSCFSDRVRPGDGDERPFGSLCGEIPSEDFLTNTDFNGFTETPGQGFLPNRFASLRLFSPSGVLVDQVAYGINGGAPVSAGIPFAIINPATIELGREAARVSGGRNPFAPDGGVPEVFAAGESAAVSTSRIPNGTDTDNDGADFNLTPNSTVNAVNAGTAAALGTAIFFTRIYASGVADDAVEFYNARFDTPINFNNWYLSDGETTQRIGLPTNIFTLLQPFEKRILRRGELGSFTFPFDFDDVLYLYDSEFTRVEQIAWWRDDGAFPLDSCMTRSPETGGFHDGNDWVTSGGDRANYTLGPVRYEPCGINAPAVGVPGDRAMLAFRGAIPNPASREKGAQLAFTVPGVEGDGALGVRIRLYDVAGRLVETVVDRPFSPGEHRVPLGRFGERGRVLAAGVYHARLEVGNDVLSRPIVILP
ncbi:MAG: lamin tail domain-containing protein [Candidatus Eiseniibacteriota bacterium]